MHHLLPEEWFRDGWTTHVARCGGLPPRYLGPWAGHFEDLLRPHVREGVAILDVGAGCDPTLRNTQALRLAEYVGLDISEQELRRAPQGSYSAVVVGDASEYQTILENRFDLVFSWQVLEHVRDVHAAVENCRRYLRPGGTFLALLSGRYSAAALLNRAIPHRLARAVNLRLLKRDPTTMFPAYYDQCTASGLRAGFDGWNVLDVEPRFVGAAYFRFSKLTLRAYLAFENWAERQGRDDLATHYFVRAVR